jgi:hypothetical protein
MTMPVPMSNFRRTLRVRRAVYLDGRLESGYLVAGGSAYLD